MTSEEIQAEQALIGSVLLDAKSLNDVDGLVSAGDFGLELHKGLWDVFQRMSSAGKAIDPVTALAEGQRAGLEISGEYIMQLMEITTTAANAEAYAGVVRENARLRTLSELAENITQAVGKKANSEKIMAAISRAVDRADELERANGVFTPQEAMISFWQHFAARQEGNSQVVSSGYQELDRLLGGGFLNSGMYVLAARPGMGKTTMAINIADNVARRGGTVLFVSLEMDEKQLTAKRLARESRMDSEKILMGTDFSADDVELLANAGSRLEAMPLLISKAPGMTVEGIAALARRVRGLKMIVVDYFGKIQVPGKFKRYEELTAVSGALKVLARTHNVPVLVLAQLNRQNEGRRDKRPELSDLRDTGALEQDADGVIFLYREDYYSRNQQDKSRPVLLECILEKNRHGSTGICRFGFNLPLSKMTPYVGHYSPPAQTAKAMGFKPLPDNTKTPFDGELEGQMKI